MKILSTRRQSLILLGVFKTSHIYYFPTSSEKLKYKFIKKLAILISNTACQNYKLFWAYPESSLVRSSVTEFTGSIVSVGGTQLAKLWNLEFLLILLCWRYLLEISPDITYHNISWWSKFAGFSLTMDAEVMETTLIWGFGSLGHIQNPRLSFCVHHHGEGSKMKSSVNFYESQQSKMIQKICKTNLTRVPASEELCPSGKKRAYLKGVIRHLQKNPK